MRLVNIISGLRLSHAGRIYFFVFFVLLSGGCSSIGKITNQAVVHLPVEEQRYSYSNHRSQHPIGSIVFLLAFSGGGTRAAALSYGVLEELRDTYYSVDGRQVRLLDEVDRISSVSGGSFTAAYYGLFGDKIFEDFKRDFLYKDVQGELKSQILGFFNILGRQYSSISRTEYAIKYYDKHIFKGKTFADLQKSDGPFILINATDLNSHNQFTFTQRQFDFLCSDLSQFKVARAVAASSAVPILFEPILIEKHPNCNFQKPNWLARTEQKAAQDNNRRLKQIVNSLNFYLDKDNPPYATLVDGGVTDNLGLRAILSNVWLSGGVKKIFKHFQKPVPVKHTVIIVVNASTTGITNIGKSRIMPSVADVLTAVTDIQLHLYNLESNSLLKREMVEWAKTVSSSGTSIRPYFIELNINDVENKNYRSLLNRIPTSLSLEKQQSDKLINVAKRLLRKNPDYQKLLRELGIHGDYSPEKRAGKNSKDN